MDEKHTRLGFANITLQESYESSCRQIVPNENSGRRANPDPLQSELAINRGAGSQEVASGRRLLSIAIQADAGDDQSEHDQRL
jgi:hypothetical protein